MPILTGAPAHTLRLLETLTSKTKYHNWNDKIIQVKPDTLGGQRRLYNTSAMYLTQEDSANRFTKIQKMLEIRGYHIVERGIMRTSVCYPLNDEFQFVERLNEIFHRIQSAGLYDLWVREDDVRLEKELVSLNIEHLETEMKNNNAGKIDEFPMVVAYGWCASIILFVIEIIWFKVSQKVSGILNKLRKISFRINSELQ